MLNLGILAHVDAGKTSLTERLLYTAGVIDEIGSVDEGSTQTDTLALERQRGITIRSAVVSFPVDGVTVNLIDTPGHPDFIAEVERALAVLDGAVLIVSAVEGVQPQTRVLMRALDRLRIPTLLFVNKIDRAGARDIAATLSPTAVPMVAVSGLGTPAAGTRRYGAADPSFTTRLVDLLSTQDDRLLAAYVADGHVPYPRLRAALAAQTRRALVQPVFCGSAITGAGVPDLMAGIAELLPAAPERAGDPVSGTVFKVERGPAGEKIAYVRLFAGTVRVRDRLPVGRIEAAKVTGIGVVEHGTAVPRDRLTAGQIGTLHGLAEVRIGDPVGTPPAGAARRSFAPPTLETVVVPSRPADRGALHAALTQLAEQDPLINLRRAGIEDELSVSLYGEVQKEVIEATLASEYGIAVEFRETTTICVERPAGTGEAVEFIDVPPNPYLATVGLRVDPAPDGSGVAFRIGIELGSLPSAFLKAVEEAVHRGLREGPHGWQVTDCVVTLTRSGYWARQSHAHAVFDKSMSSTAGDFRGLTPLVLAGALRRAGTRVYEPLLRFRVDTPADTLGAVLPVLARLRAVPHATVPHGPACVLEGEIPAARVYRLRQELPGCTRGEGTVEVAFARYAAVTGEPPVRPGYREPLSSRPG
jgi:ribosomal protection tetracycline resistance protein